MEPDLYFSNMAPDWRDALAPIARNIKQMDEFLKAEQEAGRNFLPARENIFRAFREPMANVRVLIVGQDPYPNPQHAMGLSFSVAQNVRPIPASLRNIFAELKSDLDLEPPPNGDLTLWAKSGVLLLNRVLTVQAGAAGSHQNKGWEQITDFAINALVNRGGPLVAILWGRAAQSLSPMLRQTPRIESPHPSPLSANRGFFGSRPFSRANELLISAGGEPVNWDLRR